MKKVMFSYSYQGFSHIKREENPDYYGLKFPCQDRCYAGIFPRNNISQNGSISLYVKNKPSEDSSIDLPITLKPHNNPFSVIALADGHGGKAYFKSEKGAEFAIQVAIEILTESVDKIAVSLEEKEYTKINKSLSKSFYKRWIKKILEDLYNTNYLIFQGDIKKLETQDKEAFNNYNNDFLKGYEMAERFKGLTRSITDDNDGCEEIDKVIKDFTRLSIKSIYGCTLAVYFEIEDKPLWYGFKVGDSDIIARFNSEFIKPIKDDPKCFLNETTSLCNADVVESFCFPEKEFLNNKPDCVLCSSDGIADSFNNEYYLKKFYDKLVFLFNEEEEGDEANSLEEIKKSLPSLSENGSGDDVSIAGFISYDDSEAAKRKRKKEINLRISTLINEAKFNEAKEYLKPYIGLNSLFYKKIIAFVNLKEVVKLFEDKKYTEFLSKAISSQKELFELENNAFSDSDIKKIINWKIVLLRYMQKYEYKRYTDFK